MTIPHADAPETPDGTARLLDAMHDLSVSKDAEIARLKERALAWEGVGRNLAQVLAGACEEMHKGGLRHCDDDLHTAADLFASTFTTQCAAHGVTP